MMGVSSLATSAPPGSLKVATVNRDSLPSTAVRLAAALNVTAGSVTVVEPVSVTVLPPTSLIVTVIG